MKPLIVLLVLVVGAGLIAAVVVITVVRVSRGQRPREQQMAELAARLDGRSRFSIRMAELGLGRPDIHWVAQSRGYVLVEHQFGKYYEFVRLPQTPGPWSP
ncbi:hypothetical protein M8542_00350 [Amycolatopsis sp. OK19-0408]|uniref:Uncharacterized protein n=1 Tax=Amycolatopsis iheyensis TaxID=2945988 RepID=A0A9X2N3H5_9PSEU|nr:hypothetical protein [Amycolatopsis iheyensis]MCR6481259.1 hypothetical protein [Amycolatopsis iheyensis]